MAPTRSNLFTPSKQNMSFVLNEGRISNLTKTKKKKVNNAVSKFKSSQSSRNFTNVQGTSSRLSEIAKPVRYHKAIDKSLAGIDKTIASLGNLSSRVLTGSNSQKSFNAKYMANAGIRDPYNFTKGSYGKKSTDDLHKKMTVIPIKMNCKLFIGHI
jgi:hypothetical protein